MKNLILSLVTLFVTSHASAELGDIPFHGRAFHFLASHKAFPKLGTVYLDHNQSYWTDVALENGSPAMLTYDEAVNYCASIGARLPNLLDFGLFKSLASGFDEKPYSFTYKGQEIVGHAQEATWIIDTIPYQGRTLGIAFDGKTGNNRYRLDLSDRFAARCVIGNTYKTREEREKFIKMLGDEYD